MPQLPDLSAAARQQRKRLLDRHIGDARGILHLGAHLGQEADRYARMQKPVLWVEARPDIHHRLQKKLVLFPGQSALCALLGDKDGAPRTFHISNNFDGASSSLFPFGRYGEGVSSLWPVLDLAMVDALELEMTRLDSLLLSHHVDPTTYDCWVIDLQGAELLALKGAVESLNACRSLLIEVSTVPVYHGGVLWPELREWLAEQGFEPLWEPAGAHDDVLFVTAGEPGRGAGTDCA